MTSVKEKAKALARKLRQKKEKREGKVHIDNVDEAKKPKAAKVKEDHHEEKKPKKQMGSGTAVGPKGGVYKVTASGKRKYGVKKSLEAVAAEDDGIDQDKIQKAIKKAKEKLNRG